MKDIRHRWAVADRYSNRLDGFREYLIRQNGEPALYPTRALARAAARPRTEFLRSRPDLRAEPHGWLPPRVVRVTVTMEWS